MSDDDSRRGTASNPLPPSKIDWTTLRRNNAMRRSREVAEQQRKQAQQQQYSNVKWWQE